MEMLIAKNCKITDRVTADWWQGRDKNGNSIWKTYTAFRFCPYGNEEGFWIKVENVVSQSNFIKSLASNTQFLWKRVTQKEYDRFLHRWTAQTKLHDCPESYAADVINRNMSDKETVDSMHDWVHHVCSSMRYDYKKALDLSGHVADGIKIRKK